MSAYSKKKKKLNTGQQEYSSRQAGVTTGIVLGVLIPIVMLIICIAFRVLKSQKEEREQNEGGMRSRPTELQRMRKLDPEDDEEPVPYTSKATVIN